LRVCSLQEATREEIFSAVDWEPDSRARTFVMIWRYGSTLTASPSWQNHTPLKTYPAS
jgi:hypothetical protein